MIFRTGSTGARARALEFSAVVVVAAWSSAAAGASMDPAPERLTAPCEPIIDARVGTVPCGEGRSVVEGGRAVTIGNFYQEDDAAWAKLMSQYAMAIAPNAMHPARTTGYGGFEFGLFGQITTVSNGESWFRRGTEGAASSAGRYPGQNAAPDSTLQLYGITARKGLPYGFELQGSIGYLANTSLVAIGGGVRVSPFEGFRKLIDLSVGGYVHTLTGTSKVKITVPALDVQASRPFVIANQVVLQPYLGWQMLWVNADSGVVDATPQTDALSSCQARPSTPAERNPNEGGGGDTGELRCQTAPGTDAPPGSAASLAKFDQNNNMVFRQVRAFRRQRLFAGLSIRWENFHAVFPHVMAEIADPEAGENDPGQGRTKRLAGLDRQLTFGATVGVAW